MRERVSSDSMIQSDMIMAYARACALCFAKVAYDHAYATLRDPGFAFSRRHMTQHDTTLLKVYSGGL